MGRDATRWRGRALGLAAGFAALAASAWGSPAPVLSVDVVGAYNPLGLKLRGEYVERWGATEGGARYLDAGGALAVSPAYAQGTLSVEGAPLPFLVMRVQGDLYGFFGSSGSLLSFDSKHSDFSADELSDRKGDERSGTGARFLLQPTLRAKFGPVLLRNQTDVARYWFDGRGPYFYEQEYDTLLQSGDVLLANRTQALVDWSEETGTRTLYVGPFYEIDRARAAGITRQRWGALGVWEGQAGGFHGGTPHAFALAGVNTQDSNRRGWLFLALGVGTTFGP